VKIVGGLGALRASAVSLAVAVSSLAAGCHGGSLVPDNGRCGPNPKLLVGANAYFGAADAGNGVEYAVAALAINQTNLYFVLAPAAGPGFPAVPAAGAVMRVSTYGGAVTEMTTGDVFQAPAFTPTSVILVGNSVSLSPPLVDIVSFPLLGNTGSVLGTASNTTASTAPATDGATVYFGDGNGVESVSAEPTLDPPPAPARVAIAFPTSIGVFGQRLVMLEPDGSVDSLPIGADGGAATTIGQGSAAVPGSLVACGASACWLATGEIDQIDPTSGPLATIATLSGPVASPASLVYDGTSFFVEGQSGPAAVTSSIVSVPGQGGAQVLVATLPSSGAIAVDDACVYFSTSTGIFSLLKSAQGAVIP
jgi:hypothetical protein